MRAAWVVSSLLAASLAVSACSWGENGSETPAQGIEQIRWTDAGARQLRAAIDKRAAHGLDHLSFGSGDKVADTRDDGRLTETALAYANALARGASDPGKLFQIYSVPRPQPDLRRGLAEALAAGDLGEWLESLAPQDDYYRKLSQTYLALRGQGDAAPPAIPDAKAPLKPGAADPRIPAIARQLAVFDYLDDAQAGGERYTPAMSAAVRRMQVDYGITPDGVIGGATLAILTLSRPDRARAIAVNMERMRWLERAPAATRIDVNIAAARLTYWRDGAIADVRKVVVGEPDTGTPQLGSPIFRLVANPSWTVPRSIERKEIAGKGAAYLRRHNMAWKNGKVVQRPGPDNALGLVKFDMRNDHSIYLHDTPAKQLFSEVQRQRSHGCVRVEDALGFAETLARDAGVIDQWHEARASDKESFVVLPHPIPVRLLYQTVLLDEEGQPMVRSDPYGWNDRVAAALGFDADSSRRIRANPQDIGP